MTEEKNPLIILKDQTRLEERTAGLIVVRRNAINLPDLSDIGISAGTYDLGFKYLNRNVLMNEYFYSVPIISRVPASFRDCPQDYVSRLSLASFQLNNRFPILRFLGGRNNQKLISCRISPKEKEFEVEFTIKTCPFLSLDNLLKIGLNLNTKLVEYNSLLDRIVPAYDLTTLIPPQVFHL